MKILKVNTWEEVKSAFRQVEEDRAHQAEVQNLQLQPSSFLYRGQSNARWTLQTTLERMVKEPVSLDEYYRTILVARPQVEAFSNNRWDLMGLQDYEKWASSRSDLFWPDFPGYEYMIYLRHHGFPSPLMDWTESPYVAAYFAYSNIPTDSNEVSIYCYSEYLGSGKSWSGGEPLITTKGPYARSHKRHFLQRCHYTLCSKLVGGTLQYDSHEAVFQKDDQTQDLLWKIIAPSSSAPEALKDLDSMNVNALSLMGSEDSLIQTLATRIYVIDHAKK